MEFKECFECYPKPGTPILCAQCLWVRANYKPMEDTKQNLESEIIRRWFLWNHLPNATEITCQNEVIDFIQEKIAEVEKRKDEEWKKKIKSLRVDQISYNTLQELLNQSDK